jgi:hypothetical protein
MPQSPMRDLTTSIGFDVSTVYSSAVDRCCVFQNSLYSQSQAKAGVGHGLHFPVEFSWSKISATQWSHRQRI